MKKVCHMTSGHRSDDVRIFHKECVSLAKAGYDVFLVAQGESYEKDGVHVVGVEKQTGSRLSRMLFTTKNVYKAALSIDADIYHIHDPELLMYATRLINKEKKVIFDSHENYPAQILHKEYLPKPMRLFIAFIYQNYEKYILKRINAVVIPCKFGGHNIFENIAKETVYIDNLPILSNIFDSNQKLSYPQVPSICYVGGLTYSRGITHLIKASYGAGVKLILCGNFNPIEYHSQLMELPEYECVDYRGFLNRDQVVDVYRESLIGMCTILNVGQYNKGDNFATKVYEYMSMGLPVIITDSPYARKVMEEYGFGICVQPDNVEEIASAIRYLLDNPDIAKQMGENGRRAVLDKFNWGIEEKKLIKLYDDLFSKAKQKMAGKTKRNGAIV
jgi:glycosyltransferase involved in cell wall biosynthesis